ncbi:hypothetical protein [Herbidospora yilanensis]|uniref:hypothetical protein n=1 Tax=Herbidospora yilanensis TaxID=354426 RepID=UPI000A4808FD|nr:hypothetical protein [Herbidospora yilanensis]
MSTRWFEIMLLAVAVIGLLALVALVVAGLRVMLSPPAAEPTKPHVVVSTAQPDRERR